MRISLISSTTSPFETIVRAARTCYKTNLDGGASDKKLFLHLLRQEESPLEHASWTFLIEGISRICSHQLVRHRIASYSQQSQRYTSESGFVVPQGLDKVQSALYEDFMLQARDFYRKLMSMGVKKEVARYVLPGGTTTSIVATFNLRSFCNLVHLRCSKKAQREIKDMTKIMLTIVTASFPTDVVSDFLACMVEKTDAKFI